MFLLQSNSYDKSRSMFAKLKLEKGKHISREIWTRARNKIDIIDVNDMRQTKAQDFYFLFYK